MKIVQLTQDKIALVDDADFEAVSQFNWHAVKYRNGFYAARNVRKPDGKWTKLHFHQFLLPGVEGIDHIDGDGLNNQRANLRPASNQQPATSNQQPATSNQQPATSNQQNQQAFRRKAEGKTSRFRGVRWHKNRQKWYALIKFDGKQTHLGCFQSEQDAARVYDVAAKQLFGEFASPNFAI